MRTCAPAWHWSLAFPSSAPVIERVSARLRAGRTFLLSDHCELWGIIGAVMTYRASNLAARSRIEDQLGLVRRNKIVKRLQACVYCCARSYGWCSTGDSFNQQRNADVGSSGCHREFCSRCPLPLCALSIDICPLQFGFCTLAVALHPFATRAPSGKMARSPAVVTLALGYSPYIPFAQRWKFKIKISN